MDVTRRCINCSIRLAHQRWRMVEDATEPMVNILYVWVSPTPVSSDNRICLECFGMLHQVAGGVTAQSPMFGHRNVCFACGVSILRARTHLVHPDCPERNVIISWTFPHLVSHLNRVCYACWLAARRNVQKQVRQDAIRPIEAFNEETDNREPPHIPVPPPLPHISVPQRQETARIISQTYSRVAATSRHCIFSGCENIERLLVPTGVKEMLLCRYRLYIPSSARVCRYSPLPRPHTSGDRRAPVGHTARSARSEATYSAPSSDRI